MKQEPSTNCAEKLVQMNSFVLGRFFQVDFRPQTLSLVTKAFVVTLVLFLTVYIFDVQSFLLLARGRPARHLVVAVGFPQRRPLN